MSSTVQKNKKPAWPLFLVAACSFIPALGFVFGAIAVSWGLISERRRAMLAVIMGGTGALLNIAAVFLVAWQLDRSDIYDQARIDATWLDLARLVDALEGYHDRTGSYPRTLQALVANPMQLRLVNIHDQAGGILSRRLYQYHLADSGNTYDVFSAGPDGVPWTTDDIRPTLPDSIARSAGYRPSGRTEGPD